MNERIASAFAPVRERYQAARDKASDLKHAAAENIRDVREAVNVIRENAPTLTTALLLIVFAIGGAAGWYLSKPFTRYAVNKEWRQQIAAKSSTVRKIVNAGHAESEALDQALIASLGDTDAKLAAAEKQLREISSRRAPAPSGIDGCRIPADRLRQQ